MGFDISNHAVDTRLLQDELIPALASGTLPGSFLQRAAELSIVARRANQWGLRVMKLGFEISDKQREIADQLEAQRKPKPGLMGRLLGRDRGDDLPEFLYTSGLPGFDSDLSVWGRPFFIVADTVDDALAVLDQYMRCDSQDLAGVDAIAQAMIARLEGLRHRVPARVLPVVAAGADGFYPLLQHLPELDEDERGLPDLQATRAAIAQRFALQARAWTQRDTDAELDDELLDEPLPASELAMETPYTLLNMAAQLLPGWMGRGHVWPTALFDKIGVNVSHVFDTPAELFEPLLRAHPALEERFSTTIEENYSLGGYVSPAKVPALRALLARHERDLILAWSDDKKISDAELPELAADFKKILEPVVLAERRGFGFIEAAEVYSGFMGVMN